MTSAAAGGGSTVAAGGTSGTTRASLLAAVAACNVELLDEFRVAAGELAAAAAEAKASPAAQEKARAAWASAIDIWQRAEVFQLGPAGTSNTPGGQGLRDQVYSWPLVSRCLVEQTLVSKAYESSDFGATSLVNTRGLAAAEYLLFYTGTDNACSPSTNINATGDWAALGPDELASRKASYASATAEGVAARAEELVKAWSSGGGNFKAQIEGAGSSGSVYTTDQMALNSISDAMFLYRDHREGREARATARDTQLRRRDLPAGRRVALRRSLADPHPQ
jgi:predicted lipoprotein